ncbi:MAG: hypothetical protein AAFX93_00835 [Verrucomicrobiota bacterium]
MSLLTNANAVLTLTFTESGGNVSLIAAGTLDTTGIFTFGNTVLVDGYTEGTAGGQVDFFTGDGSMSSQLNIPFTPPASSLFHDNSVAVPRVNSIAGVAAVGIIVNDPGMFLFLPESYVPNAPIFGSALYPGVDFNDLRLIPGNYTLVTLGTGDRIDVDVVAPVAAVPEPAVIVASIGMIGLLGLVIRRRFHAKKVIC